MRRFACAVAVLCVGLLGHAYAGCYSVHDSTGKTVFRSAHAPVDLSGPMGDAVRARFGDGAHMVVNVVTEDCLPLSEDSAEKPFEGAGWAKVQTGSIASYADAQVISVTPAYSGGGYDGGQGYYGSAGAYGGSAYSGGRRSAMGYPHVGPRGGHYRITSGGHRSYRGRGR